MSRKTMRFVFAKSAEQQAGLMLMVMCDRLIRNRRQLANAICGHAAEFGLTAAQGMVHVTLLLDGPVSRASSRVVGTFSQRLTVGWLIRPDIAPSILHGASLNPGSWRSASRSSKSS